MKLSGKVAIVTGGSSGIGKAVAALFLREGAKVCIIDKQQPSIESMTEKAGRLIFLQADITYQEEVKRAVEQAFRKFRKINILCNNAGDYFEKSTINSSVEDWRNMMEVNATSAFLCCKYSIPYMIKSGKGSIVNMSSVDAFRGEEKCPAYSAAKSAVIGFTKSLARELAQHDIRVNCIVPGPILTPMFKRNNNMQEMLYIKKNVLLRRLGLPEDVAKAIMFMASDDSSFITGQSLIIDGGWI